MIDLKVVFLINHQDLPLETSPVLLAKEISGCLCIGSSDGNG
jgi:hypothetical protein